MTPNQLILRIVEAIYGDKGVTVESTDAEKLSALADIFDKIDAAMIEFIGDPEMVNDPERSQIQDDLRRIARDLQLNARYVSDLWASGG